MGDPLTREQLAEWTPSDHEKVEAFVASVEKMCNLSEGDARLLIGLVLAAYGYQSLRFAYENTRAALRVRDEEITELKGVVRDLVQAVHSCPDFNQELIAAVDHAATRVRP